MVEYILLGIIQGLTEFLPVSSSGHLVLLQRILGITESNLFIIIFLHLATTLSLVIFFFNDIIRAIRNPRLIFNILIVTTITGLIALGAKDFFSSLFSSVKMVSLSLLITGIILISTKRFIRYNRGIKDINVKDSLLLGLTQAIAIIPGISRSGITISCLLFRKIDRESAFRFSFLVSIPAIFGAFLLEAKELNFDFSSINLNSILGFISAFFTGLVSLYFLKAILKREMFFYFGYYCILISILSWVFLK